MSAIPDHGKSRFNREVVPRLERIARRVRMYALVEGLAAAAVVTLLCFAVQFGLDRWLRLRVDLRGGLLIAVVVVLGVTLWRRLLQPLSARVEAGDVAASAERRYPQIQSRLISAVEFCGGAQLDPANHSPVLVSRVIDQAAEQAPSWPLEALLDHGRARGHVFTCFAVLAVFAGLTLGAPTAMGIWFDRNILLGGTSWPQQTYLELLNDDNKDGVLYAPVGDDLSLKIRWTGVRPDHVRVRVEVQGGATEVHDMTAVGQDQFRHTLAQVTEPLRLWFRGADASIDDIRVELVERPRVASAVIHITPPAYTQRAPFDLSSGKNLVEVLPGSSVDIRIQTTSSSPVVSARLYRDQQPLELAVTADGGFLAQLTPGEDANYWFELTDERGLQNLNPRQFMVRMSIDSAPTAALELPDAGPLITPQAQLTAAMIFGDAYGLASARLLYSIDDAPEPQVVDLDLSPGTTRLTASQLLNVPDLEAQEGQRLMVHCEASDLNDIGGPGVGRSTEFVYRVVSTEELLADLARREQEYFQEFARLIETQESLRNTLLSVARALQTDPTATARLTDVVSTQRRERQLGRQVAHVRSQFQRIHAELVINQLDSEQVRERLVRGIVEPLETLGSRLIPELADRIETLTASPQLTQFRSVDLEIADVLTEMRRILENMTKWEGFHESIRLLQTIVKMQKELQKETSENMDQQFQDLFDEDPDK